MIGIDNWTEAVVVILGSILGMLAFASATQGYLIGRCKWWEIAFLLIAAFILLRPSFIWDEIYPPHYEKKGSELIRSISNETTNTQLRVQVKGQKINGDFYKKLIIVKVQKNVEVKQALSQSGVSIRTEKDRIIIDNVEFGSLAEKAGFSFDQELIGLQIPTKRPAKQWGYIPAIIFVVLVFLFQKKREIKSNRVATMQE